MGAVKSMGSDAGDPMTKSRASAAFCDGSGRFVPDQFHSWYCSRRRFQIPLKENSNSTGLVISIRYSSCVRAPQLSSPAMPICRLLIFSTV